MKKTILIAVLNVIFFSNAFSQVTPFTVKGRVTSSSTGAGVPYTIIYINTDSNLTWNYFDTVMTDSAGFYSKIIVPPSGTFSFNAFIRNCGNVTFRYFTNSASIVNVDFAICTSTPPPCVADFWYSATGNPYEYNFYDNSTGSLTYYEWLFGDGTSYSPLLNPVHTFPHPGTYTVSHVIWGSNGCKDSIAKWVVVYDSNTSSCHTHYTWNDSNLTVHFNGIGYGSDSSMTFNYGWSFGDGTSSTLQNPVHTFGSASNWYVCLHTWGVDSNNDTCYSYYCDYVDLVSTRYYTISGMIYNPGYSVDHAIAYLIYYNPNDSTLTAIDTTYSMDSSGVAFYNFANVPAGSYLVKAALTSSSVNYSHCMPTYYPNALYWNQATYATVNSTYPHTYANVQLITGTNPGGPGFIGGKTSQGANFLITPGDPVPAIEILLLDNSTGAPVSCDFSDNNGAFDFSGLPYGTYKVYAEVPGITTEPAIITIDAANPSVTDVKVIISSKIITSIEDNNSSIKKAGHIYPNPATDEIFMDLTIAHTTDIDISIRDIAGKEVYHSVKKFTAGNYSLPVNISGYPSGLYQFILSTPDGSLKVTEFMVR